MHPSIGIFDADMFSAYKPLLNANAPLAEIQQRLIATDVNVRRSINKISLNNFIQQNSILSTIVLVLLNTEFTDFVTTMSSLGVPNLRRLMLEVPGISTSIPIRHRGTEIAALGKTTEGARNMLMGIAIGLDLRLHTTLIVDILVIALMRSTKWWLSQ